MIGSYRTARHTARKSPRRVASLAVRCLCALACLSPCLAGGEPSRDDDDSRTIDSSELVQQVLEHDQIKERRTVGLGRVRVSYPQKLSGALGAMFVRQPPDYDCTTVCDYRGLLFQVEPGLAGGQLSLGYALLVAEKRRNKFFLSSIYAGVGIKGAVLRTWGDSSLDPSDQTFAGAEVDVTLTSVNLSLGYFRRISDEVAADNSLFSFGLGWGF